MLLAVVSGYSAMEWRLLYVRCFALGLFFGPLSVCSKRVRPIVAAIGLVAFFLSMGKVVGCVGVVVSILKLRPRKGLS